MKRKDEEFCKSQFNDLILQLGLGVPEHIRWEEVQQADEPPDYYLWLKEQRYAVEITSVIDLIPTKPRPQPSLGISSALSRLVDEVEREAQRQGILNGAYAVSLEPLDNFDMVKPAIIKGLLQYIVDTQHIPKASSRIVFENEGQDCTIEKLHHDKDYVAEAISYPAKWEGEAATELCAGLKSILQTKKRKLKDITYPVVLILLDVYHYSANRIWKDCLDQIEVRYAFHTICKVGGGRDSSILFTQSSEWSAFAI
jgi:hypothetical protein